VLTKTPAIIGPYRRVTPLVRRAATLVLFLTVVAGVGAPPALALDLPPGQLTVPVAGTVNQPGAVSGLGGIDKTLGGTLNFTGGGVVTYFGPTNILAGTVGGTALNSLSPNSAFTLSVGTTLDLNGFNQTIASLAGAGTVTFGAGTLTTGGNDTSTTYAGTITGTGGLTKVGAGVFTLSGTNTYSGGTTVNAGTLSVSSDGNLGATSGGLALNGGTLRYGAGFTSARTVTLGGGGGTIDTNGFDATLTGIISGAGAFTKNGTGVLTVNGTNTYSGGTTVNAGTLSVSSDGNLGATSGGLTLNGATLRYGAGFTSARAVTLGAGGGTVDTNGFDATLAGIMSGAGALTKAGAGILTLNGINTYSGLTAVSAGTLAIGDVNNPNASVAGSIAVDAGTLQGHGNVLGTLTNFGGTVAPGGSIGRLTVGQFTQGPNGTLRIEVSPTVASQLRVLGAANLNGTLALAYQPGSYTAARYPILTASSITGTFPNVTGTVPTPGFLQSIDYLPNEVDLVLGTDPRVVANAGVWADQTTAIIAGGHEAIGMLLQRLAAPADTGGTRASLPMAMRTATASTSTGYGTDAAQALIAELPAAFARIDGWFRAVGSFASVSGTSRVPGFDTRAGGFLAGVDRPFGDAARAGIVIGYVRTNVSQVDRVSATVDTPRVALYGSERLGPLVLDGALGYAFNHLETVRPIAGVGATATSERDGHEASAALQVRYRVPLGAIGVTPRGGAQYEHLTLDGLTERGAAPFNLSSSSVETDSLRPFVGVGADGIFKTGDGVRIAPELRLVYAREMLDVTRTSTVTTSAAEVFRVAGVSPSRDILTVGTGIAVRGGALELYANYDVMVPIGNMIRHTVSAGLQYRF
jgi:fibronectin-binding autotransporter adhesin